MLMCQGTPRNFTMDISIVLTMINTTMFLFCITANPCKTGLPLSSANSAWFTCNYQVANACPNGYWCHVGATTLSTVCCPVIR